MPDRMKHRLHTPELPHDTSFLVIDRDASHYLCRVLRLKANDELRCFDGIGTERQVQIQKADPRACELVLGRVTRALPPPAPNATVVQAMLKGDALDRAIQRATELGAARIQLVWSERSEVKLRGERLQRKLGHWRKIAISASEQSGRVWVPEVLEPKPLADYLTQAQADNVLKIVMDLNGEPFPNRLAGVEGVEAMKSKAGNVQAALLVGPEGGFSEPERERLAMGWRRYQLGHQILRAETAPGAALTALFQATGWPDC